MTDRLTSRCGSRCRCLLGTDCGADSSVARVSVPTHALVRAGDVHAVRGLVTIVVAGCTFVLVCGEIK